MSIVLRPYQNEALDQLNDYWTEGVRPLVVAPTGSGKSILIAEFLRREFEAHPELQAIVATHSQELVRQNREEFEGLAPALKASTFSAGLREKDHNGEVVFANIQSIYKHPHLWPRVDILIVDEAHRIPSDDNSQYQQFIEGLKAINPNLAVVGFTATPYRMDIGLLHEGEDAIFDGIAYDVSLVSLVDDGYLAPLRSKGGIQSIDLSSVPVRAGEFGIRELEESALSVTEAAVAELIDYGQDRKSWLVFTSSVKHAGEVKRLLRSAGINAETITAQTPGSERALIISKFKGGLTRCIVNVDVLTTGFNAPRTDLIALLTATRSCGKYVQMLGRGMRTAPDKEDCLVLDFGGNVERFGAVERARPVPPRSKEGDGSAPYKTCPSCRSHLATASRICDICGHEFPAPEPAITHTATSARVYVGNSEDTEVKEIALPGGMRYVVPVWSMKVQRHKKAGRPDSVRLDFLHPLGKASMWLAPDHSQGALRHARRYILRAGGQARSVDEVLDECDSWTLPTHLTVEEGQWYYHVKKIHFEGERI